MSSEKILVTGASGFLGATAFELLKDKGENVLGTSRDPESASSKKLGLIRLDTTNSEETDRFIRDKLTKTIFHFTGISKPREAQDNPEQAKLANIDSVMNLIHAILVARESNPDYDPVIVVAGSVEQFGDQKHKDQVFDESSKKNPLNLYASQKDEMAIAFLNLCETFKIRGYVVIQGPASGVSPSGNFSQSRGFLIPDMASQVAMLENCGQKSGVVVTGEISHQRNIVDVKDAVEAYISLAKEKPAIGEYIVCADESVPLSEILKIMIHNSTIDLISEIDKSRGFGKASDRFYSHQKLTEATGWKPKIPVEKTSVDVLNFQRNQTTEPVR